jgi:hypothetical protein
MFIAAHVHHHAFDEPGNCVAVVTLPPNLTAIDALQFAYDQTNSHEGPWYQNTPTVKPRPENWESPTGCRSTSIGDEIVLVDDRDTRQRHRVARAGFTPVAAD